MGDLSLATVPTVSFLQSPVGFCLLVLGLNVKCLVGGHWWVKDAVYSSFLMLSFFRVYTAASLRVQLYVSCASHRVP